MLAKAAGTDKPKARPTQPIADNTSHTQKPLVLKNKKSSIKLVFMKAILAAGEQRND